MGRRALTWRPEEQRGIGGGGEREGRQLPNQKDIEFEKQSDIGGQWRPEAQTGDQRAKNRDGGQRGLGWVQTAQSLMGTEPECQRGWNPGHGDWEVRGARWPEDCRDI